jgi:hypothetical protein
MTTTALRHRTIETALVKGEHCILDEDGTVRVFDEVAGYFVLADRAPSARSVKAAITAGRTGSVRVATSGA